MRIVTTDFVAGAREARGVAIVIDVFRACTTICHAFARGAERVIPVAGIDEALALRTANPEWRSAGERHARRLPGFDFGNSPWDISRGDLAGRTLVHTTHAGTQGLTGATHATHVFTGALVNASATAAHVLSLAPEQVTIVRMGHEARERCAEDDVCAELLLARLEGATDVAERFSVAAVRARLRDAPAAVKFFDPAADWAPEPDFDLCTAVDAFDFPVELVRDGSAHPWLRRAQA